MRVVSSRHCRFGLKMYALSAGCGSFRRRPFSASPCPPAAAAAVGGRARSRVPGRPPGSCPRRSGARRAVCAQGFLSAASGRPCAPLCVSPAAPPLPLLARVSGALRGVLAPLRLGLALAAGGVAGAPLPRPLRGFARSRSPGGGSCRGCRRGLWLLRRPPGVGVGAAAAAAAARLRRPVLLPARAGRGLWFWGLARRCCGLRCGCAV